jgi:hypothetical protein
MKMLCVLCLFVVNFSCAGANMQPTNSGLAKDYFPLKTGLYWKYRYTGMPRQPVDVELRISEEKEINGKLYFRATTWFSLTRNVTPGEVWVCWHEGNIYLYDGQNEKQVIGIGIEQTVFKKNDVLSPVETAAGKFTDVVLFQDCVGCADAGNNYYLARDKGVVLVTMSAIWGSAKYELIETNAP